MSGDDRLRTELENLECSVPASGTSPDASRGSAPWLRLSLLGATIVVAAAVTAVAIGPFQPPTIGTATPSPNPAVVAEARDGDVILTLSSPHSRWTTDLPVEIHATLTYVGNRDRVTIGGAGVGFSLVQISGGESKLTPAMAMICILDLYSLQPNAPVDVPFLKPAANYRNNEFFRDGELYLSAGRWRVSAWTPIGLEECSGLDLDAAIEIEVVASDDADLPSALPTMTTHPSSSVLPAPSDSPRACPAALAAGVLGVDDRGQPMLLAADFDGPVRITWLYPDLVRVDNGPPLQIYDQVGRLLAKEGDYVTLGGGFGSGDADFHACGVLSSEPTDTGNVACDLREQECELALGAAAPLLYDDTDRPQVVVGPGRGLRVWHTEVHACWTDGRYLLIDVIGPGGEQLPAIDELTVTIRDAPSNDPPCN